MTAKELDELVRKKLGRRKYRSDVWLTREWPEEDEPRLKCEAFEGLKDLQSRIEEVLPDDFSYSIRFGGGDLSFNLFYEDGPAAVTLVQLGFEVNVDRLEQFEDLPWDDLRGVAIERAKILEKVARLSWRDSSESPTALLRQRHREWVDNFESDREIAESDFALLAAYETFMCFGKDGGMERETYPSRDSLVGDIYNMLATDRFVLAARVAGEWLKPEEIDLLCADSRLGLGPISRSTAESRYERMMDEF